jgi:hypothetical protein
MNKNSFRKYISLVVFMFLVAGTLNMAAGQKNRTLLSAKENLLDKGASTEASVPAIFVSGNPSCATLNANNAGFPTITSDFGFKVNVASSTNNGTGTFPLQNGASGQLELTGGAPTDTSNSITTNVSGNTLTSWSSTLSIDAVIVKGGPDANVYVYSPEAFSDTNLTTPGGDFGVSHVEFCYDYETRLTIIKDATPNSPTDFPFTSSGTGATNNGIGSFTLDDDGGNDNTFSNTITFPITATGANNPITITEGMVSGWQLRPNGGIVCSQSGPGSMNNNTIDIGNRRVTVIVEPNESVTCTFFNDLVLAAGGNIAGRINNLEGRAFKSISLTATALSTGEKFYTNADSSGNYLFEGLPVNDNYLITIKSRGLRFEPDSKIITLNSDLADIDFTAYPSITRGSK